MSATTVVAQCRRCGHDLTIADYDSSDYLGEDAEGRIAYLWYYVCPTCGHLTSERWTEG